MHYTEAGSGPPLGFLHGLGGSIADWEHQIPYFARQHRVIVPELRGFGSSGLGRRRYEIARLAQDVIELLDGLGVECFRLIGHSMGGAVAQQLALMQPTRVERLVIANSVPSFQPQSPRHYLELGYRMLLMGLLGPGVIARIGAWRQFPKPEQAEERKKSIARGRRNRRSSYLAALAALSRWTAIPRLEELRLPVLVIASEHDFFTREETLQFAHALPRGRLHTFKHAHHGLPAEMPAAFNAVVARFLDAAGSHLRRKRDRA